MVKTLLAQVKEYKRASIITPVFMVLEVLMEILIPTLMAALIDNGVNKGDVRYVCILGCIMAVMAGLSLLFGVATILQGTGSFGVYFALFGLAAIFMFSGVSVLPTARNNKNAIMARNEKAQQDMAGYLKGYRGEFPLPARYAHPIVLRRMQRAIEEGRAARIPDALETVKQDLKALNAEVEVDQQEYDEVVAVKALFLNEDYR